MTSNRRRTALVFVGWCTAFGVIAIATHSVTGARPVEQAFIGLTEESEWPNHDTNLLVAASQLDDGTIVEDAQRDLGLRLDGSDVWTDHQRQAGSGVLTITGRASDSASAAALVNRVAADIVEAADVPVFVANEADGNRGQPSALVVFVAGAVVGGVGFALTSRSPSP